MAKLKTITLDEKDHAVLRKLTARSGARSMRALLAELILSAASSVELKQFEKAVSDAVRQSKDPEGFQQYLSQSYIVDLLLFLDDTRPTYRDVSMLQATMRFWSIKSFEFFETLLTYAKFGLSELQQENE